MLSFTFIPYQFHLFWPPGLSGSCESGSHRADRFGASPFDAPGLLIKRRRSVRRPARGLRARLDQSILQPRLWGAVVPWLIFLKCAPLRPA